jgi:hypothetical protein
LGFGLWILVFDKSPKVCYDSARTVKSVHRKAVMQLVLVLSTIIIVLIVVLLPVQEPMVVGR